MGSIGQLELGLVKTSCAVVYLSSAITAPNMCNPQVKSILLDLSSIFDVHLVARTRPGNEGTCRVCQACGAEVTLIPISAPQRHWPLAHAMNFAKTAAKLARALRGIGPECIYAINLDALTAIGHRWLRRVPVVYHALEIYHGTGEGGFSRSNMYGLERKLANYVDIWVVPSQIRAKYYADLYPFIEPIVWLNAPSVSELGMLTDTGECGKQRPSSNDLVYTGGLSDSRDLRPLLYAMREMRDAGTDVSLSIYTNSHAYLSSVIQPIIDVLDLNSCVFTKKYEVERVQLIRELRQYSRSIVLYGNSVVNERLCAPTKLVDAMIARTSWLGTDLPGTRSWLEEFGGGSVCDTNSRQEMAVELLSNSQVPYKCSTKELIAYQNAALSALRENLQI